METTVIDFRRPLKQNTKLSNKNDFLNNKDFSSTLESLNNKINSKDSLQNTSRPKENRKITVTKKDEELKEDKEINIESPKEEDEKKEYSLALGNMIYFFNRGSDVEENSTNNVEMQLSISTDTESSVLKENLENILGTNDEDKELLVENKTFDLTIKEDKAEEDINIMEFDLRHASSEIKGDNVEENKLNSKEFKANSKTLQNEMQEEKNEEISAANETNLSYIEQADEKMEFSSEQKQNSKSSSFENRLDIDEVEKTDRNIEVNDESFVSIDKNGIRFEKDNTVELDKPEIIDRKEVIEQIVHKVKVDLSDAKNEIKVKLKPEVLGEMTMNIEVIKGSVTAKIMVENQRTKEIIEGNLIQLKEGIKDTGLEIKTVEVFVGNNSDFDKHESGQFNLKQNNKRIKIKAQDNKTALGYGEQSIENVTNTNEAYLENSLNLFA